MKNFSPFVLLAGGLLSASAQEATLTLPDLIQGAAAWAQNNLDTNWLNALPQLDQQKKEQLLRELQKQFQGNYVVNLAQLRGTTELLLPLLDKFAETQPYAAWLKPRLSYLQVADELFFTIPPPPPEIPGQPPAPRPNPPPQTEREIWLKRVTVTPWPEAASNHVVRLKPIFAAAKVPRELVWLAEVESGFDARARSPMGAAGLFQLMPDTARRLGLSLWPRDERLQPEPSARAAAQYLKLLYAQFKDWRLALAAYNSGEGTVQRLLKQHDARSFDAIATSLPAETQMFVPRLEAVVLRREGVQLAQLPAPK